MALTNGRTLSTFPPLCTPRRRWHNAGFSVSTFPAPCFDDYCGHPSTEDLCSTASGRTDPLRENIEKDDAGVRTERSIIDGKELLIFKSPFYVVTCDPLASGVFLPSMDTIVTCWPRDPGV